MRNESPNESKIINKNERLKYQKLLYKKEQQIEKLKHQLAEKEQEIEKLAKYIQKQLNMEELWL